MESDKKAEDEKKQNMKNRYEEQIEYLETKIDEQEMDLSIFKKKILETNDGKN